VPITTSGHANTPFPATSPFSGVAPAVRTFAHNYGRAHLGKSLTWYFSELLFAYYLTEICGLRPLAMGITLAASFCFSATVDFVAGRLMSMRVTSLRSACALQFPGALASGAALAAFSATALVTPGWRFVYALTWSCLFRLAYVFYDMPQNCMLVLASGTPDVRIRLSATRQINSGIATIIIAIATALLIGGNPLQHAIPFLIFSVALAAIGAVTAMALRPNLSEHSDTVPTPAAVPTSAASQRPRALWVCIALQFVVVGTSGVFGRLESYFTANAFPDVVARTTVLVGIATGGAVGQLGWSWLVRKRSFRDGFLATAMVWAVGCILFFCTGRSVGATALAGAVYGCGLSGLALILWAATAAVSAEQWGTRGDSAPAMAFGLLAGCSKLGSALAVLMVSALLLNIDYHNPVVSSSWVLLAPMTGVPLAGALMCIALAGAIAHPRQLPKPLTGRERAGAR
jgi:Na+/melibiose symporter-like transporter